MAFSKVVKIEEGGMKSGKANADVIGAMLGNTAELVDAEKPDEERDGELDGSSILGIVNCKLTSFFSLIKHTKPTAIPKQNKFPDGDGLFVSTS